LTVRRSVRLLSQEELACFQVDTNPLLHTDNPPQETRQTILLASMRQIMERFPERTLEFIGYFLPRLIQPRTMADRLHDLEASVVELRMLASDQLAQNAMLMTTINQQNEQLSQFQQRIRTLENELRIESREQE
jgi:hypothetical protein